MRSDPRPLSLAERQVLRLAAEGLVTAEVAHHLGWSVDEVRAEVGRAMSATGARSKLEAIVVAMRRGELGELSPMARPPNATSDYVSRPACRGGSCDGG